MATPKPPQIVLGLANVGDIVTDPMARYGTPEAVKSLLDTFLGRGYHHLDTARNYSPNAPGSSEPLIGTALSLYDDDNNKLAFIISTKTLPHHGGGGEHPLSRANIEKNIKASLTALQVSQIDIEYLHEPDRSVPFEETCEAMDKAYRAGKFRRFGLSNHSCEDIEKIVTLCAERGFVKPSVYQGQYNAIARGVEKELLPVLRKYGISLYAYSPAAAGMFAGKPIDTTQRGSRWDASYPVGQLYAHWYLHPPILSAVARAVDIANQHGISGHAASLRWVAFHSALDAQFGDAIIIGASSIEQLGQNLDVFEQGALPQEVAEAYSAVYGPLDVDGDDIPWHL